VFGSFWWGWSGWVVACWVVEGGEFGADLLGVGVVEVVEDGQCVLPGGAGRVRVAGGLAGVAEAGEGSGFAVPLADLLEEG
jgi:hypothetical protein